MGGPCVDFRRNEELLLLVTYVVEGDCLLVVDPLGLFLRTAHFIESF